VASCRNVSTLPLLTSYGGESFNPIIEPQEKETEKERHRQSLDGFPSCSTLPLAWCLVAFWWLQELNFNALLFKKPIVSSTKCKVNSSRLSHIRPVPHRTFNDRNIHRHVIYVSRAISPFQSLFFDPPNGQLVRGNLPE
jgi:hypothetical protein